MPRDDEQVEEEDPEQRLIRQIEEYKLFKEQGEVLAKIEDIDRFYKKPDNSVGEFKYELPEKLSVDALIHAFTDIMQKMTIKAEVVQEKKIEKEKFTVAQKITQIKDWLITKDRFRFKDMFEESYRKQMFDYDFESIEEGYKVERNYEMIDDIEFKLGTFTK